MIPHKCACALAAPVLILGRIIFEIGEWPDIWKFHSLVALYKKSSPSDPNNYREVRRTFQIFKVVERVLGHLVARSLSKRWATALAKSRTTRDEVPAMLLCTRLSAGFDL